MQNIIFLVLFLLHFTAAYAVFIGNPSSPALQQQGLILKRTNMLLLRAGVEIDYLWKLNCEDEFIRDDSTPSHLQMLNCLGTLTATLFNRFELSGLIGTSRINFNNEMRPDSALGYGFGGKFLLLKGHFFDLAINGTYFKTDQQPTSLLIEGMKLPLLTDLKLHYEEAQGCLAISYKKRPIIPYVGVTYLYTRISPNVYKGVIDFPDVGPIDFFARNTVPTHEWGAVVGASLLTRQFIFFSLEGRFFNQYAVSGQLEFRF